MHLPWLGQARQAAPEERAATETEGWERGGHLLPVGWASRATPGEPGRCSPSQVLRREPSSPSSSHQPATLDMASRLQGAWAPCTQPSNCKASSKISPWRHRVTCPWTGHSSVHLQGHGSNPSGMKRGKSLHPTIHCRYHVQEQSLSEPPITSVLFQPHLPHRKPLQLLPM